VKLRSLVLMSAASAAALALAPPARAESHKLLVLQSEGRADAGTRAKIDAAILKLAAQAEPQTAAGELNFSDAATAVGCKPDSSLCKDQVMGMLSVDEIVITTVTPKPGGLEVSVRRFTKGGGMHDASMLLATGASPEHLDGIAPLFGVTPPPSANRPAPPPPPPGPTITAEHPTSEPPPPVLPPPNTVQEPPPSPIEQPAAPPGPADQGVSDSRRHLELAGMAAGGAMFVAGLVFWLEANSTQNDINNAPTATRQNLMDLKDLESRGSTYATLGNVFGIAGLAVGAVSTVFYFRDRRAPAHSVAIGPALFNHGAGVALTLGGNP
jgi:hypothetical protein